MKAFIYRLCTFCECLITKWVKKMEWNLCINEFYDLLRSFRSFFRCNLVFFHRYQPLVLISLDGFRADYLIRNFTPNIRRLSQCGVHAPYMRSVYPTKTFPNHYSIVTVSSSFLQSWTINNVKLSFQCFLIVDIYSFLKGLYPESHGIVDNNMYDTEITEKFSLSSPNASDPRWWGGEPVSITTLHVDKLWIYFVESCFNVD